MMYVDPTSQYKFVAKTAANLPGLEASSTITNIANDAATVPTTESTSPTTVQAPPNTATHFQAPEHAQKQAVLLQNAGVVGTVQSGQIPPAAAAQLAQGVAAGIPGQGLTYDGKRMRKTMQRRTVDYNSSVIRFLESRKWFKSSRNQHTLQPQEIYNVDIVPPCGYIKNPMNAVTTKFVRTSTNKLRCPIFCVVWTPEGRRLVTGASSGEFTLWNGLTFNFETILQAHDRAVRSMVWSNNDLWLLTGDHGGFVKYWQSNMNNVKMYEAHKEPVRGLSFSPSDNKFASCSDDGLVKVWDFYRCIEERELKGHGADVKCVDWHPTKGLIVSGSKDSQQPVKLWDPKTGNSITTLHCHKSTVMTAKWNKNGNWLVTGSRDHLLKLFDIRMMKELQTFRGHKKEATVVAWHPVHETLFASGGSDGSLMFWLTGVDEKAGTMDKAHEGIVWSLSWHPLGHILCSGSNDHTSKFWARNRPGDTMIDKYNLDIQGSQEDGDFTSEEGTSHASVPALAAYDASQVIPGVGLPVTASNVVLPDSRDVDAHLYGESGKDKMAVGKPSTATSSELPYPPAFSRSNFENRFGIPGLDMPNANIQIKQENDGYKISNLREPPKLRLPTRLPIPPNQSHYPPSGIRPPLTNHPGNHPPFGPRHGFDFRGPSGPRIGDPNANFGPAGSFPPNQYARFPGPRGGMHEGPRGGFGAQRGPHPGPWSGPHHASRGGPFEPYGPQGGPNPQNKPPNNYGHRDGQHEGPRPHGDPSSPHVRPDGPYGVPRSHDISISQYGPHGGTQSRGAPNSSNMRSEDSHGGPKPPLNIPGRHDGPQGEPHGLSADSNSRADHPHEGQRPGRRGPNVRSEERHYGASRQHDSAPDGIKEEPRRDSTSGGSRPRDDSHDGSHEGQHETPHGGSRSTDFPPGQHGPRDGPRGGPRPPLNIPPTNFSTSSQHGPRDGTRDGPRPRGLQNDSSIRPDGPRGDPRPPLNIPLGPSSPRDSSNFGPRTVNNDTGRSFGPRGSRPPHFQKPRPGQPKAELKSPEGDHRGASEARESFLRRSRDNSPRDSPPVKQERRTSDPDAPGILGDFQTHIQELQRGMLTLENITSSAVGRLFRPPQPDMAGPDRPPHGRSDMDRHHGPDSGRGIGRKGDRDRSEADRRGDRPPYESRDRQDRSSRDRPGDSDRPPFDRSEMGLKEERSSHDRSDMSRPKDRPSFEGFSGDRPSRSGGRNSFDRQDSGRQSDGSFSDEKDLPVNEKPGLLPIPDMFLARGPPPHDGPPHDSGSSNHRPPDRRRDHGRFQDGRNDIRPDKQGFGRGPRDQPHTETIQGKSGGSRNDGPQATGETGIKPLMSLLDAPPVNLGSPPGHGNVENRGRKRSMEHEFDRPPKRMGTGDNRERHR